MKLTEMIQCVDEPDKTRTYRAQISGFDLERLEEVFGLLDLFDRRVVLDGFTREPATNCIDCTTGNLRVQSKSFVTRTPLGGRDDSTSAISSTG